MSKLLQRQWTNQMMTHHERDTRLATDGDHDPGDHDPETERLLDEQAMRKVIDMTRTFCGAKGELNALVESWWGRSQRWARNRAAMTSDQRDVRVTMQRKHRGVTVGVSLNQIDPASLRGAADLLNYYVEKLAKNRGEDLMLEIPRSEAKGIPVWSDRTFERSAEENGRVVHAVTARAEANGLFSAGYLETIGSRVITYHRDVWGRETYRMGRVTFGQCSMTVRHPKGIGSGWAGNASFDLDKINVDAIATLAFDKCQKSLNPVRIEPGRYQTILEPQAVSEFVNVFLQVLSRDRDERLPLPLWLDYDQSLKRGRSKLGLHIMDRRLSLSHDPEDPLSGTHPQDGVGKITIVEDGMLSNLFQRDDYTRRELSLPNNLKRARASYVMRGTETTTMEEMIASTKRGLLVTRVSPPEVLDESSLLSTGMTRDGLWLIENGKISKAVRNFRWTESPMFIFNNVETIGESVPTFVSGYIRWRFDPNTFQDSAASWIVPSLKVNDFSFTSTIDAI